MNVDTEVWDVVQKMLVGVRKSGPENVMALCPFHVKGNGMPETTPSFALSLTTGLWICHSCHEKGTLRSFLRAMGTTPLLIDTFYKPLFEAIDERIVRQKGRQDRIMNDLVEHVLPESSLGLFDYCPMGLIEEGFHEETLRRFDIGFDAKNQRVTFPIRDLAGRIVGISGRSVTDEGPRYKVYSHREYSAWELPTISTDKGMFLWNIDKVYPQAFYDPNPSIILVEGFKACMWLWQAGFTNVVALMGSSMSKDQQKMLERLGGRLTLFLDNDGAGQKGTFWVGRRLHLRIPKVRVALYDEKQPTDLSPDQVRETVNRSVEYNQWAA